MDKPYRYKKNNSSFAHYWKQGIGKNLLQKIGYTPSLKNAEELIPQLFAWDKSADQVIIDLYLEKGIVTGNNSLMSYLDNDFVPLSEKKIWDNFFTTVTLDPPWLDREKLNKGAEFCRRSGLSALIVLRDYCLMGGYESAAINKPLIYTGALKKGAVKRLTDTVEFWVQITKENALNTGSEGLKQVFLTRMIHSYSRVNILAKTDWETSKWGIPINTWDMLATNIGFSLVFMVGLGQIGIHPTAAETEGLFHFWKYIGYLLGIPLELLPDNEEQAINALYLWTMTQREGDEDSKALAKALKQEPLEAKYPTNHLFRQMMKEIHLFYNQYLLGDYSCELLGLPKTTIGRFGVVNIWRARKAEKYITDEQSRLKAVSDGGKEQERVRQIYQKYNK